MPAYANGYGDEIRIGFRPIAGHCCGTAPFRERVVYREVPVYEPAPRYYEQPAVQYYGVGDRVVGKAVGAIAGGVIGNQFGKGSGRVAATAVCVVGGIIGGNMATYRY